MTDFVLIFVGGLVVGAACAGYAVAKRVDNNMERSCQGTPWIIEESLITKTLTCEVKLKEKK